LSQIPKICDALKALLRERGITYRDLAASLDMSEANVKRMFSQHSLSLARLEEICRVLHLSLHDFFALAEPVNSEITQLSQEQEQQLVDNPTLCLVAVCVRDGWSYEEIIEHYRISEHECVQLLAQLDRLKLLQLLPGNKYKVLISRNLRWIPGGPLERFITEDVISKFLQGSFTEEESFRFYLRGSYSQASIHHLQRRLEQLTAEAEELNRVDAKLPLSQRTHIGILMAMRPWELSQFQKLRR
jgi:DNA-binding Xre family transcriptional regulator